MTKLVSTGIGRQRGASLVMSMIILVVLMLLSVSAVMVSNTQMKLAGNMQFETLAAVDSESALSRAENWLSIPDNTTTLASFGAPGCVAGNDPAGSGCGLYAKGALTSDPLTMTWNGDTSIQAKDAAGNVMTNQRFIIEVYAENRTLPGNSGGTCGYAMPGPCPNVNLFRVTGRGVGALGSVRYVQSLFALRTGL